MKTWSDLGQETITTQDVVSELNRRGYYRLAVISVPDVTMPLTTVMRPTRSQILALAVDQELSSRAYPAIPSKITYISENIYSEISNNSLIRANTAGQPYGEVFTISDVIMELRSRGYFMEAAILISPIATTTPIPITPDITTIPEPSYTPPVLTVTEPKRPPTFEYVLEYATTEILTYRGYDPFPADVLYIYKPTYLRLVIEITDKANVYGAEFKYTFSNTNTVSVLNARHIFMEQSLPLQTPLLPVLTEPVTIGPTYPVVTPEPTLVFTPPATTVTTKKDNTLLYLGVAAVAVLMMSDEVKKRRKRKTQQGQPQIIVV